METNTEVTMTERSRTSKNRKEKWERVRLLSLPSLTLFKPIFKFANHSHPNIDEGNCRDVLWQAMGKERLCVGTYLTPDGVIKKRTWATEFAGDHTVQELTSFPPTISGQEATAVEVERLRQKVKRALDFIISKVGSVTRQRSGMESDAWVKRTKEHDLNSKHFGFESDYLTLPWSATHLEEQNEIIDFVLREFDAQDSREAIIHRGDFLCFVDEGEDGARTLSWTLILLVELVFERELAVLRKCQCCESFFVYEKRKARKFCKDSCRYNKNRRG